MLMVMLMFGPLTGGFFIEGELLVVSVGSNGDDLSGHRGALRHHRIDERATVWAKLFVAGDCLAALITSLGDHVPPSEVLCHGYASVGRQNLRAMDGSLSPHRARPGCVCRGNLDIRTPAGQSLTLGVGNRQFSL